MNWRLKSAIRHAVLAAPGGVRLYRWLTIELMGTMGGMAAKWFRVFPAHIGVLQKHFGDAARAQPMWCFDSGATTAAGLAMALVTDVPGLLTDRFDRLSNRYALISREVLARDGPKLAVLSHAPADRLGDILREIDGLKSRAALGAVRMTCSPRHSLAEETPWCGTIGCIFSAGTLEHYAPEQLETELARMKNALAPNGILSHVVDHRDHRWHADKRISPLLHLTLGDADYRRRFGNPLDFHNRWLRSRYVALFEDHGFEVEYRDVIRYTDDLPPLDRVALAREFTGATEEDLRSLVTHFIARRRT